VQRQHGHIAKFGSSPNRAGNRARNVVEFQIEEDLKTKARKPVDDSRAFGRVKLATNFD
jgi:hypothetical protein